MVSSGMLQVESVGLLFRKEREREIKDVFKIWLEEFEQWSYPMLRCRDGAHWGGTSLLGKRGGERRTDTFETYVSHVLNSIQPEARPP